MADIIKECLKKAKLDRAKQRRALAWLLVLSMFTSFGVMWQMRGVGEAQSMEYVCGLDEHTHMDSCYPRNEICGFEESEGHTHTEDCYAQQEGMACAVEAHAHGESCYALVDEMVCPLHETPGHTHVEECYGDVTQYACGSQEHTHTDACYTVVSTLQCGQTEAPAHHHGEGCYTSQTNLTCGQTEAPAHYHDQGCYTSQTNLTCGQAEGEEHAHSDGCYTTSQILTCTQAQTDGHTHSDACYAASQVLTCAQAETEGHIHDASCAKEERTLTCASGEHTHTAGCGVTTSRSLVCGLAEEEPHTHTDECFQAQLMLTCMLPEHEHTPECVGLVEELICGETEQEPHAHDDSCYAYGRLNCTLEHRHTAQCYVKQTLACDLQHEHFKDCYVDFATCGWIEHTHDETCASNPEADLVTRAGWEASVPKTLTGVWSDDLLAVAASQLGFGESTRNFVIDENGQRQGYNRYGAFYSGSDEGAYGEWSAKFVAFCLHYAGVEGVSTNSGAYAWFIQMTNSGALAADAVTNPGDLIFLDCSGNGSVDRVAIVSDSDNAAWVTVYEGDAPDGTVRRHTYALIGEDAVSLMGIYHLPENPALAPAETTVPFEETTVPFEETTVPFEETTSPTETTAPTEETTAPTEAPEELGSLSAYVLSYDDYSISFYAMARSAAPAPQGAGISLGKDGKTTITGVTLESQEYEGGPWTSEPTNEPIGINGKSALRFEFKYHIPANTLSPENNHVTYQMPIPPVKAESGNVLDDNGEIVGVYTIGMDGKVDIIFNDEYVKKNQDGNAISGFFRFKVSTKTLEDIVTDEKEIGITDNLTITIKNDIPSELTLDKTTWLDTKTKTLKYTIKIKSNKGTDGQPVNLSDYLQGDTGKFQNVTVKKNGGTAENVTVTGQEHGNMNIQLPAMAAGDEYLIEYEIPVDQMPDDGKITNKAKVESNGANGDEDEITVDIPNNLNVEKTGKANGRTIEYTVTIESPYGTDKEVTVTDAFGKFDYIKDFDPTKIIVKDQNGNLVQPQNVRETSNGFAMELPKMTPGQKYTLTYIVDVADIPGNNLYIYNKVNASTEIVNGSDDETVTITQTSLKKVGVLDGDKIRWEITVNQSKQDIGGWTLKDVYNWADYPVKNATITPAIIVDGEEKSTIDLPFTFPEGAKDSYVITFETEASVGMNAPTNRADLNPGPGMPGEGISDTAPTPPGWENKNPLKKEGKFNDPGDSAAATATVDWTITIDRSLGDITAPWTFTESLQNRKSYFTAEQMKAAYEAFKNALTDAQLSDLTSSWNFVAIDEAWQQHPVNENFSGDGHYSGFKVTFDKPLTKDASSLVFNITSTVPYANSDLKGQQWVTNQINVKDAYANSTIEYTPPGGEGDTGEPKPTLNKWISGNYDENRANGQIQWQVEVKIPRDCKGDYTLVDTLPQGLDLVYLMLNPAYSGDKLILPGGGSSGTIEIIYWSSGTFYVDYRIIQEQNTEGKLETKIYLDIPEAMIKAFAGNPIILTVGCNLNSTAGNAYGEIKTDGFLNKAHVTKKGETDILAEVESYHEGVTINKKKVYKSHGYGTGDNTYQADTIPYKVVVNPLAQTLLTAEEAPLKLKDELVFKPSNKLMDVSLVPGSVKLYQLDSSGARVRLLSVQEAPWTITRTMDDQGYAHRVLDITIPDGMAIEVNYSYKLVGTENSSVIISNSATLYGKTTTIVTDGETTTLKFQESSAGAQISGLSLIKVDAENAALELTGAKFQLYKWDEGRNDYVQITSGTDTPEQKLLDEEDYLKFDNGRIDLKNVDHDVAYKLVEIAAPKGYQLPTNPAYEFVLYTKPDAPFAGPENSANINRMGDGSIIRIPNMRNTAGVTVFKISSEDNTLLPDAAFKLEKYGNEGWTDVTSQTEMKTDSKGRLYIDSIDRDIPYRLTETKAPNGFILGAPIYFFVPDQNTAGVISNVAEAPNGGQVPAIGSGNVIYVTNSPSPKLNLNKQDADLHTPLPGAEFNIYKWDSSANNYAADPLNGTPIVTDLNGIAKLDDYVVEQGVAYKLVETHAPDGYILPDEEAARSCEFYIKGGAVPTPGGRTIPGYESGGTVLITNRAKPNMTILKVDANDHSITLPGAEFTLYQWETDKYVPVKKDGEDVVVYTGSDGRVNIRDLEHDRAYRLVETDPPVGYAAPTGYFEFVIKSAPDAAVSGPNPFTGEALVNGGALEIENESNTKLTLIKKDGVTGARLPGAEFRLDAWSNTGFITVKEGLVTDASGTIELGPYITIGTPYRLVETAPPAGYQKNPLITYFAVDPSWFAPTKANVEDLKVAKKDEPETLLKLEEADAEKYVEQLRYNWPYSLTHLPGGMPCRILNVGKGSYQGVPDSELHILNYAIEDTQVSVTKHWNGPADRDEIAFDLYRTEIPANLTAGPNVKRLTVRDNEDFGQGAWFKNLSGYYPEGSMVTFRVYYVHGSWQDNGQYRKCNAYLNDTLLPPAEEEGYGLYGTDLLYSTYTVKMDADKEVVLNLPDNYDDFEVPRWYAEVLSVSLTESSKPISEASPAPAALSADEGIAPIAEGDTVKLTFEVYSGYSQGAYVGTTGDYFKYESGQPLIIDVDHPRGAEKTYTFTYGYGNWNKPTVVLENDGVSTPYTGEVDETKPGELSTANTEVHDYIVSIPLTLERDTSFKVILPDSSSDQAVDGKMAAKWKFSGGEVSGGGNQDPPPDPNPGGEVIEGEEYEQKDGVLVHSYTLVKQADGTWEIRNIPDLPLIGYNANNQQVFYSYYVKETTTGNFTTTYLNNGGITSGEITIVNTPNNVAKFSLLKQSAELDASGKRQPLAGAVFKLQQLKEENGTWVVDSDAQEMTLTTGEDGLINLASHVALGATYRLEEITPPTGYQISEGAKEYIFTFRVDNPAGDATSAINIGTEQKTLHTLGNNYRIVVNNQRVDVSVRFVKKTAETETPLAGAKFTLERLDDPKQTWDLISSNDGALDTTGIQFISGAVYRLTETKAPEGYRKSNKVFTFTIDPTLAADAATETVTVEGIGEVTKVPSGYTYTAVNALKPTDQTQLKVEKKWMDKAGEELTENIPESISVNIYQRSVTGDHSSDKLWFGVWDEHDNYQQCQTDGTFENLSGFFPKDTTVRFRLYYNGSQKPIEPTDERWNTDALKLRVIKSDCDNGIFEYEATVTDSKQALFTLEDNVNGNWTGEIIGARLPDADPATAGGIPYGDTLLLNSANDWTYIVENLPLSGEANGKTYFYTYYAVEQPLNGYETSYETTYQTNGQTVTVTNTQVDVPKVTVKKVDAENSEKPVAGATFVIEKAKLNDGSWISYENVARLTTDGTGLLKFEDLQYDTPYRIREISAPAGYILNYQPYYFVFPRDATKVGMPNYRDAYIDYLSAPDSVTELHACLGGSKEIVIPFEDRPLDTDTSIEVVKQWSDNSAEHDAIHVTLHRVKADYAAGNRPEGYVALNFKDDNDPEQNNFVDRYGYVPAGSTVKFRVVFARDDEGRRNLDAEVGGQTLTAESSGPLADGMYQHIYQLTVNSDTDVMLHLAGKGSEIGRRYGEYGHSLWYLEFLDIQAPLPSQSSSSGGSESSNPSDSPADVKKYHLELKSFAVKDYPDIGIAYHKDFEWYPEGTELTVTVAYNGSCSAEYPFNNLGYSLNDGGWKNLIGAQNSFPFTVKVVMNQDIVLNFQARDNNEKDLSQNPWKVTVEVAKQGNGGSSAGSGGTGPSTTTTPSLRDSVFKEFTLSNADGWKKSITDLPKVEYDGQGNPTYYTYYVVEKPVEGFVTTYYVNGVEVKLEDLPSAAVPGGKLAIKNEKPGDKPVYELPKTGSIGALPFTLLGLTLMAAPIGYAADQCLRKRKSRKTK